VTVQAVAGAVYTLELRRLRLLLERRVAWLRLGWQQDAADDLGTAVITDAQIDRILSIEGPQDAEERFYTDDPAARAIGGAIAELEQELSRRETPTPLDTLVDAFGLTPFERDLLLLLFAPELDPGFELLFGYLHDDVSRRYVSAHLAMGVLRPDAPAAFAASAPLRRFALMHIEPPPQPAMALALRPLRLDPRIVDHLHGVARFDDLVAEVVRPLESGPLAPEHAALADGIAGSSDRTDRTNRTDRTDRTYVSYSSYTSYPTEGPQVINLIGSPQTGKETLAVAIAARANRSVHKVDPRRLPPLGPERTATMKALEREARLLRLAYYIQPPERDDVNSEVAMQDLVETLDAPLFVDTRDAWPGARRVSVVRVERPDRNAQRLLWATAVGADETLAAFIDDLVEQFDFSPEMIARAARAAGGVTSARVLWDVCQQQVSWRIDDLAQRITTRQKWDDLVLEPDATAQLREISSQVAQRARVYERWGFAARLTRGRGITALFAGPSGTGKTMAAEILAGELGLELYRIDLAGVVSKYIGESEKNLRRVFDAAEQSGAILFFDEADALFGKRTDVKDSHDLYANIQVNYLLQRMEDYRGLAILATNRKTSLDRAFLRRLRFVIDFPFPDADARARIWQNAFPKEAPVGKLDYEFLARLEIAGGNIRNIALGAAFLAAADGSGIDERHVMHAVRREYAKIQKLVTETEFGPHYRERS
jgi:hypothetical protein